MRILGIDPGSNTGCAHFDDGQLHKLATIAPVDVPTMLANVRPHLVVFEDSRLQSHMWMKSKNYATSVKMARNLGQVDAWCSLIVAVCDQLGITAYGMSPKAKGAKVSAEAFESITRWTKKSNQHERDSAMVAWPHRNWKGDK
jgi:hypothetical protein